MYGLTKKEKVEFIIKKVKELDITSYDIGKNTQLSVSGIDKILNGISKSPQEKTLNKILEFLQSKTVRTSIKEIQHSAAEKEPFYTKTDNYKIEDILELEKAKFKLNNEVLNLTKEVFKLQNLLRKNNIDFENIFE